MLAHGRRGHFGARGDILGQEGMVWGRRGHFEAGGDGLGQEGTARGRRGWLRAQEVGQQLCIAGFCRRCISGWIRPCSPLQKGRVLTALGGLNRVAWVGGCGGLHRVGDAGPSGGTAAGVGVAGVPRRGGRAGEAVGHRSRLAHAGARQMGASLGGPWGALPPGKGGNVGIWDLQLRAVGVEGREPTPAPPSAIGDRLS